MYSADERILSENLSEILANSYEKYYTLYINCFCEVTVMFNKLGFQLFTIREYIKDLDVCDAALKKLVKLGYTECHGACVEDRPELGDLVVKNGIDMVGTNYSWWHMVNKPEETMELHARWNCKLLGPGALSSEEMKSPEALDKFIYDFNKTAEIYAKKGFKLTYHNHSFEFMRIDGYKTIMDVFIEKMDKDTTSFVLDTGWAAVAGVDVAELIEKLEGRIDILHLKDFTIKKDNSWRFEPETTEVGYGNVSWDRIIAAAEKIGVKHYCVEQDRCEYDSLKSLGMSAEFLKKYMA